MGLILLFIAINVKPNKLATLTLTEKIFRQINSLVISFIKTSFSRNFCQKSMGVFPQCAFTTTHCGNYENLLLLKKYFVKSLI